MVRGKILYAAGKWPTIDLAAVAKELHDYAIPEGLHGRSGGAAPMKDESMKKQNFLQGAAILAAATLIVKLLGFLFKTPLNYIIGETGSSYFYNAYRVYDVLLMISTTGLPSR